MTFFAIVAVIHDQGLFAPVIDFVLAQAGRAQLAAIFGAAGSLSAISDNVFVATVYITEVAQAYDAGEITRTQFEQLAIAINTGTNIPSIATPNGQAAFLFLLTSSARAADPARLRTDAVDGAAVHDRCSSRSRWRRPSSLTAELRRRSPS